MEKANQGTRHCYCYKCPLHQTDSPDEGLRMSSSPKCLSTRATSPIHCIENRTRQAGTENNPLEYLLEVHRPTESVQVQTCENRKQAGMMEECECCLKPSAGMYLVTLGGIKQIQLRKGGSSSSGSDAETQTSTAAGPGRPHTPSTFNDDAPGRDSTSAHRPEFPHLDVACQTNIRALMSPQACSPEHPRRHSKGEIGEATNSMNTSNHLGETKDKNPCHHNWGRVHQLAVLTLIVGVMGYLAINHQKYLNRQ